MNPGDLLFGRRTRQNHALEHATVTLLARRAPSLAASARSYRRGFTIYADLDRAVVRAAAEEALARLQAGEAALAIHPNCGTNAAMGVSLACSIALGGLMAARTRTRVLSAAAGLAAGCAGARPLGRVMQQHVTTLADLRDVRITAVGTKRVLGRRVVVVRTR